MNHVLDAGDIVVRVQDDSTLAALHTAQAGAGVVVAYEADATDPRVTACTGHRTPDEALLVLRRFIGVPLPATDWRIRAVMRPDGERIRVRLADTAGQNALVDLPTSFGRERGIDYLVGDPLWRGATPSAAPGSAS
ncbi:hypothetical protein ACFYZT_06625 [Streptomyces sp. NPDC001591]|uniref:hypothetical protein n=1 Tax=Streptomyces sp. NPDC001591 TaxID=3364589 RepID=UPI0036813BFC